LKVILQNNISDLLDAFVAAGVLPTITRPTRITHASVTLIDNIYVKYFQVLFYLKIRPFAYSDMHGETTVCQN